MAFAVSYKIEKQAADEVVSIVGPIDAHFLGGVSDLAARVGKSVVLDLSGIQQIDSVGVRGWLEFIRVLCEDRKVRLRDCSFDFVQQFMMISAVIGQATVESFNFMLFCANCPQEQQEILVRVAEPVGAVLTRIDATVCKDCGKPMETDEDIATLLGSLKPRPIS